MSSHGSQIWLQHLKSSGCSWCGDDRCYSHESTAQWVRIRTRSLFIFFVYSFHHQLLSVLGVLASVRWCGLDHHEKAFKLLLQWATCVGCHWLRGGNVLNEMMTAIEVGQPVFQYLIQSVLCGGNRLTALCPASMKCHSTPVARTKPATSTNKSK